MKKLSLSIALFAGSILFACDNKTEENKDASANETSSSTDTSATVDTTTMYEKQHYGNGSTKTSGNSGH